MTFPKKNILIHLRLLSKFLNIIGKLQRHLTKSQRKIISNHLPTLMFLNTREKHQRHLTKFLRKIISNNQQTLMFQNTIEKHQFLRRNITRALNPFQFQHMNGLKFHSMHHQLKKSPFLIQLLKSLKYH